MGLFQIPEKELAHYIKEISSGREDVLEKFYKKYAKSMYTIIFSYVSSKESAEEQKCKGVAFQSDQKCFVQKTGRRQAPAR